MRRTNGFTAGLLLAALLAIVAAPTASASPASIFGSLEIGGRSLSSWWAVLAGETKCISAASEVTPPSDPDGNEATPRIDPNGYEVEPSLAPEGNEATPRIDPNG